MRIVLRVAFVLTALLVGACATPAPGDPTAEQPTDAAPPTGLPEPATIVAPVDAQSPEAAAEALFQAWMADDRSAAEALMDPAADADLDALFAQPFDAGAGWSYDHCEGAAGSVFCTWHATSATLVVRVRGVERPPLVTSIRMESAEAP